jgi:hypothetical protein
MVTFCLNRINRLGYKFSCNIIHLKFYMRVVFQFVTEFCLPPERIGIICQI